ncbi:MAG: nuclear transport factor 2 family protein [Actinomycetota bacterium]|nr:nuclear transport factor 2 family protein [Actinomycetota bacterium]
MTGGTVVSAEVLAHVQQFYTHQMALSENGAVREWADTFTEDAVFEDSFTPEPLRGRAAILESVRDGVARIAEARLDFRHWFGMFEVESAPDGRVRTRYYALAMATPRDGVLAVRGNAHCQDILVPHGDGWLVHSRTLRFDGVE